MKIKAQREMRSHTRRNTISSKGYDEFEILLPQATLSDWAIPVVLPNTGNTSYLGSQYVQNNIVGVHLLSDRSPNTSGRIGENDYGYYTKP